MERPGCWGGLHPSRVRGRVVGRKVRARGDPARQLGTQSRSGGEGGAERKGEGSRPQLESVAPDPIHHLCDSASVQSSPWPIQE